MTPEGYVKDELKKLLRIGPIARVDWPVGRGMGTPMLDCHAIVNGTALVIECKAPGEEPTRRQMDTLESLWAAGAVVGVFHYNKVAHEADVAYVREILDFLQSGDRHLARAVARRWARTKTYDGKPINLEVR